MASSALLVRALEGKLSRVSEMDREALKATLAEAEAHLATDKPVNERLAAARRTVSTLLRTPLASTAALLLGELDALTSAGPGVEELRQAEVLLATAQSVASARSENAA